ncbi:MAG: BolA family transcriptional regulator [Gammaproteobacteria bacterium]|nr:BolA family transcriptional regulator [Gammaproteobacteria bacterium]
MDAVERLRQCLTEALSPSRLDIQDDSHRHAGHAGARRGGHYRVFIVCDRFAGKPLIARHRLVYQAVFGKMKGDVHALSIVARAPQEVTGTLPGA